MNKFIPIILLCVCGIVAVIGVLSLRGGSDEPKVSATQSPPPLPDGHVARPDAMEISDAIAYNTQLQGAAAEVQSLRRSVQEYAATTEQKIAEATRKTVQYELPKIELRLREELRKEAQAQLPKEPILPPTQTNRVVDAPAITRPTPAPTTNNTGRLLVNSSSDIPPGFGFDGVDLSRARNNANVLLNMQPPSAGVAPSGMPGYVKISAWRPNSLSNPLPTANGGAVRNAAFPNATNNGDRVLDRTADATAQKNAKKPEPLPVYTIENTSTLFSNTTMTALMGVVPNRNNAIKNMMRFKLITGAENIASNGLVLPDVKNIVWTGYAIGNREMECVQATVDTVTFTFQDGTIRTVSEKQAGGAGGQLSEGLGYLSDRWGKPCIKGTLISNATQYLRDRMIAAGAAATAAAAAAAETTTQRDGVGGGTSTAVTGDMGNYIAGQTGTATLNELAAYLRDRMDQAVDIIYLDAGKDVTIHVEKEITIDYDPAGRKLSHIAMRSSQGPTARMRLD
ncbi:Hypothetical protein HDN1F_35100 [gamma proteobacterium HdN1]|nr:Hypothetical protein HDN1F_18090 [gamma proteobacterium HdN1]CBL47093.1 Hypothetical protein HDN1F_35100 [gamma proteobacterium HdN1]